MPLATAESCLRIGAWITIRSRSATFPVLVRRRMFGFPRFTKKLSLNPLLNGCKALLNNGLDRDSSVLRGILRRIPNADSSSRNSSGVSLRNLRSSGRAISSPAGRTASDPCGGRSGTDEGSRTAATGRVTPASSSGAVPAASGPRCRRIPAGCSHATPHEAPRGCAPPRRASPDTPSSAGPCGPRPRRGWRRTDAKAGGEDLPGPTTPTRGRGPTPGRSTVRGSDPGT